MLEVKHLYKFGNFSLCAEESVLRRDGEVVPLTPKMFELLLVLVTNAGKVLDKEYLLKSVWPDSFVEEGNISFNIRQLRKALGDDAQSPTYIETVPRRGYRFVSEVKATLPVEETVEEEPVEPAPVSEAVPQSRNRLVYPLTAIFMVLFAAAALGLYFYPGQSVDGLPIMATPFSSEKLSTNGRASTVAISPDGKTVVYTDTLNGKQSVWLRQLDIGNNIQIIPPADDTYYGFLFSPDNNFLYFARRPKGSDNHSDIYRVSIFGGVPTRIASEAQGWLTLSPDGTKISYVRCYYNDDEYCSLWIAEADGKNERKLLTRQRPIRIGDLGISPDGRSIAFAYGQSRNASNEFNVGLVDIETGEERPMTAEKFFNIKHMTWLPDQSGVLITASRIPNKHFRIWQVSIDGSATPLTRDSETYSILSLDRNASKLVATQIKEDFQVKLIDLERPAQPAAVLADGNRGTIAKNGRIYFSSVVSGNNEIWSMTPDGADRRQLTNELADDSAPIAAVDGSAVFFVSNRTGAAHIWKMNSDGSDQTQVTHNEGGFPAFSSPDGEWLYYSHALQGSLWRVSLKNGTEELVFEDRKGFFSGSPDGSRVVFYETRGDEKLIVTRSLADRRETNVFRIPENAVKVIEVKWMPDSRGLLVLTSNIDLEKNTLWHQPIDGGPPRKLVELGDEEISDIDVSHDGKQLIVAQGSWKHDAVLITGLG